MPSHKQGSSLVVGELLNGPVTLCATSLRDTLLVFSALARSFTTASPISTAAAYRKVIVTVADSISFTMEKCKANETQVGGTATAGAGKQ